MKHLILLGLVGAVVMGLAGCQKKEVVAEPEGGGIDQFSNRVLGEEADSGSVKSADSTTTLIENPQYEDFGVALPKDAVAQGPGGAYVRDTPRAVETRYELTSKSKLEDVEKFYVETLTEGKANRMGGQSLVSGKTADGLASLVTLEDDGKGGTLIKVEVFKSK